MIAEVPYGNVVAKCRARTLFDSRIHRGVSKSNVRVNSDFRRRVGLAGPLVDSHEPVEFLERVSESAMSVVVAKPACAEAHILTAKQPKPVFLPQAIIPNLLFEPPVIL